MTVRLRPHHLLCLLTYVGKGYSPAFTANYDRIAERLSQGETIEIIAGPDDICAPLLGDDDPHCRRESVVERDSRAARDLHDLLGLATAPGNRITLDPDMLAAMRAAFHQGTTRSACTGCEWNDLCSSIAAEGYLETRVSMIAVPSPRPVPPLTLLHAAPRRRAGRSTGGSRS